MNKKLKLTAMVFALALLQQGMLMADDLFQLAWRGRAYRTDSNGRVSARTLTEAEFIKQVARDHGVSASDLVFVYRANKRDTAVVRASTGRFVANIIQMEYNFTDAASSDGSVVVRQAFLFDEYHDAAIGSAAGVERTRRNSNGDLIGFSFNGTFQYSTPENGTVYLGTFSTGRRIKERF